MLIDEADYLCATFAGERPAGVRWLYRKSLPLTRPLIARANGVTDPENVACCFERTREALDLVAAQAEANGHLVGGGFSVADLSCAALLAPLVSPPHPDMQKPQPMLERIEAFLARWASHPGAQWVLEQYARNRPPSSALAG